MEAGEEVICPDNYFTGRKATAHWINHPRFEPIRHDVTEPIKLEKSDLAPGLPCLASALPVQSGQNRQTSFWYLQHAGAGPAGRARLLMASTSGCKRPGCILSLRAIAAA